MERKIVFLLTSRIPVERRTVVKIPSEGPIVSPVTMIVSQDRSDSGYSKLDVSLTEQLPSPPPPPLLPPPIPEVQCPACLEPIPRSQLDSGSHKCAVAMTTAESTTTAQLQLCEYCGKPLPSADRNLHHLESHSFHFFPGLQVEGITHSMFHSLIEDVILPKYVCKNNRCGVCKIYFNSGRTGLRWHVIHSHYKVLAARLTDLQLKRRRKPRVCKRKPKKTIVTGQTEILQPLMPSPILSVKEAVPSLQNEHLNSVLVQHESESLLSSMEEVIDTFEMVTTHTPYVVEDGMESVVVMGSIEEVYDNVERKTTPTLCIVEDGIESLLSSMEKGFDPVEIESTPTLSGPKIEME